MILNKDPLFSVHPVGGHRKDTVLNAIVYYQQRHRQNYKIRFAHRLDRDTSGALIVAKNKWMHEEISRQFRQDGVLKEYLALCHNSFRNLCCRRKIGPGRRNIQGVSRRRKESCLKFLHLPQQMSARCLKPFRRPAGRIRFVFILLQKDIRLLVCALWGKR